MTSSDQHPWPHRVERVLAGLSSDWQTFAQMFPTGSALDAKQHTGALVWLRNRSKVASRRTNAGVMQWRLR